jgi:hypothetical protein
MSNWPRLIARRVTPVSQWMTIVSRDVQFSPGADAETYYAIHQPSYVAAIALTPEGRILLVRTSTDPQLRGFHSNFPADWSTRMRMIRPTRWFASCSRRRLSDTID